MFMRSLLWVKPTKNEFRMATSTGHVFTLPCPVGGCNVPEELSIEPLTNVWLMPVHHPDLASLSLVGIISIVEHYNMNQDWIKIRE